jgi:hypothetical protein
VAAAVATTAPQAPLVQRATHTVSAYPGCGEAVIQKRLPSRANKLSATERLRSLDAVTISEKAAQRIVRDTPIGSARAEGEATRRARTSVRRWCTDNRADHLWTGNLAPKYATHDRDDMWRLVERFRRNLRDLGITNPMLIVLEPHPGGHGLHWHAAVPGRMDWHVVRRAWSSTPHLDADHPDFDPFGFVQFEPPKRHHRRHTTSRIQAARTIAGYLGKYVGKDFSEDGGGIEGEPKAPEDPPAPSHIGFNRKRYSTTRGTAPVCKRDAFLAPSAAYAWMRSTLGGEIRKQWDSSQSQGWEGPPTALYTVVT